MPIGANQDILWFQIPVHDVQRVDVLDCQKGLSDEEPSLVFFEDFSDTQMVCEVTAWAQIQDHVQVLWRLERIVHFQNKRVGSAFQNVCLTYGILQMIIFDKELFVQDFHGHSVWFRVFVTFEIDFENLSKCALSQHFLDIEWFEGDAVGRIIVEIFIRHLRLFDFRRIYFYQNWHHRFFVFRHNFLSLCALETIWLCFLLRLLNLCFGYWWTFLWRLLSAWFSLQVVIKLLARWASACAGSTRVLSGCHAGLGWDIKRASAATQLVWARRCGALVNSNGLHLCCHELRSFLDSVVIGTYLKSRRVLIHVHLWQLQLYHRVDQVISKVNAALAVFCFTTVDAVGCAYLVPNLDQVLQPDIELSCHIDLIYPKVDHV